MFLLMHQLLLSETAGSTSNLQDPLTYLVDLGPIGVIIVLFVTGMLYPKSTVDRLIEENKAKDEIIKSKDEINNRLQESLTDKAIPALTRSTLILESLPNSERQSLEEVRVLQARLADLVASLNRGGGR